MADTRYLLKQRQVWYLRVRVPADVKEKVGKREIVKSLRRGTCQSRRDGAMLA
jgi:hypothetical protein